MVDEGRPTTAELRDASKALVDMVTANIIGGKAVAKSTHATIACALALHAGEKFASDKAAKRTFGVQACTNVRILWLPRLHRLDEWRLGQAEVIDANPPGMQPAPEFQCRHQPSCQAEWLHKRLCEVHAAARRRRWKRKAAKKRAAEKLAMTEATRLTAASSSNGKRPSNEPIPGPTRSGPLPRHT